MSEVRENMPIDSNGNPIQALPLHGSVDLDGSAPAEAHTDALTGNKNGSGIARIAAITAIRYLVGVDAEAAAGSIYLPEGAIEYYPFSTGERVSVYGGKANISVCGKLV